MRLHLGYEDPLNHEPTTRESNEHRHAWPDDFAVRARWLAWCQKARVNFTKHSFDLRKGGKEERDISKAVSFGHNDEGSSRDNLEVHGSRVPLVVRDACFCSTRDETTSQTRYLSM